MLIYIYIYVYIYVYIYIYVYNTYTPLCPCGTSVERSKAITNSLILGLGIERFLTGPQPYCLYRPPLSHGSFSTIFAITLRYHFPSAMGMDGKRWKCIAGCGMHDGG